MAFNGKPPYQAGGAAWLSFRRSCAQFNRRCPAPVAECRPASAAEVPCSAGAVLHSDQRLNQREWGDGIVPQLAQYIARTQPGMRGFTRDNLFRMKQFYDTYRDNCHGRTTSSSSGRANGPRSANFICEWRYPCNARRLCVWTDRTATKGWAAALGNDPISSLELITSRGEWRQFRDLRS
jgi:hypothetical protein